MTNRQILAWILKCCMPEFENKGIHEIAARYIISKPQISKIVVFPDEPVSSRIQDIGTEDVSITEGTVTFDIRFQTICPVSQKQVSLIINIEAQDNFYPGYPPAKRGIYYCSRMISSQYGTVFTDSHYEKLQKVYSIWICTNPPKKRSNTVTAYSIAENNLVGSFKEKQQNYDLLTMIFICLGKPVPASEENTNTDNILRLLDILLSSELNVQTKTDILEHEFSIPMTEELKKEVYHMCNVSDGIERKGIKKGIRKGRREGRCDDIRNLIRNMKLTTEQAMDALSIPMSERAMYERMLKH